MIVREAIYKGATRPAMKWGVPLIGLVGVLTPIFLATLWLGSLVTPWAFAVGITMGGASFAWMRVITARDDQRLAQSIKAIRLAMSNRNRKLFGLRSYGAYRAQGAKDVWRR